MYQLTSISIKYLIKHLIITFNVSNIFLKMVKIKNEYIIEFNNIK